MQQLTFEEPGRYAWRNVAEPEITGPQQALVRPLAVACCDLDVAVAEGELPMPPGHAMGHEGLAEVVAVGDDVHDVRVGDRVIVPFQINCGDCRACGITGSCALEAYTEWMKGLLTLLPDGNAAVRSFAVDQARNNVAVFGVFRGTHTGEGGRCRRPGRSRRATSSTSWTSTAARSAT
jgi:threonine dehydrogenase-like Zn-dependent dehydrogenase